MENESIDIVEEPPVQADGDPPRRKSDERRKSQAERRAGQERRQGDGKDYEGPERRESVVDRRLGLDRRRGPGRRRSDSRRSAEEGEMSPEQFEFVMAIDEYKRLNSRPFPSWTEVLDIIHALGYRKVAEPGGLE